MTQRMIAFLGARLDEEEALARGCSSPSWTVGLGNVRGGPYVRTPGPGPYMTRMLGEPFHDRLASMLPPVEGRWVADVGGTTGKYESEERNATHMAYWDPARVLAGICAQRRILEDYALTCAIEAAAGARIEAALPHPDAGDLDEWVRANREASVMRGQVEQLAGAYAEHPDYASECGETDVSADRKEPEDG